MAWTCHSPSLGNIRTHRSATSPSMAQGRHNGSSSPAALPHVSIITTTLHPPALVLCSASVLHASPRGLGHVSWGPVRSLWPWLTSPGTCRKRVPSITPPLEAAAQSPTGSPHSPAWLASPLGSPASSHGGSRAAIRLLQGILSSPRENPSVWLTTSHTPRGATTGGGHFSRRVFVVSS